MQSWLPGAASLADELRRAGVGWLQGGGAEVVPHEMMAVLEGFHPKLSVIVLPSCPDSPAMKMARFPVARFTATSPSRRERKH